MKTNVTFTIDFEVLGDFLATVKKENTTPDVLIEKIIKNYIINGDIVPPPPPPPPHDDEIGKLLKSGEYVKCTQVLLQGCKKYKVGQFANILLRGLLERGVAAEEEVEAMQRIPSWRLARKLKLPSGDYSNRNFGLNFPLLTEVGGSQFLIAKAYRTPIKIYGKVYYLCSQWFELESNNDRAYLEKWITEHLPKWLETASEKQKEEFKHFIDMNI